MPSDILIIPNRNSTTAAPVMQFSGSQGNSIRLEVLTSGSVAFLGKSGSLFSISDNFSGSLMAVGDISGLPILEVFSDDRVVMGRFNSNTLVVTGSGVGIGKSNPNQAVRLDVSGSVFISGSTSITGSLTVSVPSGTAAAFTSGNVGIGKTTPSVPLDVNGDTFITGSLNVAANTNQSITLYANGTGLVSVGNMSGAGTRTRLEIAQVGIRLFYIENTAVGGHLAFGDGGGEYFRMQASSNQSVLFGTTINSNNGRLQLATHTTTASGVGFGTDISLSRSAGDTLDFTVTSGAPTLRFMNGATYRGYVGTNGATAVLNSQLGGIQLQTNATVALSLDTSQNATLSGNYFYVGGAGNFYVRATGANNGLIRANIFSTDVDGDFRVRNAAGTQDFLTVDSQKAVFSGSIGLGKTPTTKLDVLGNVFITGSLSVTDGVAAPADYKNNLHPFLFITFL